MTDRRSRLFVYGTLLGAAACRRLAPSVEGVSVALARLAISKHAY